MERYFKKLLLYFMFYFIELENTIYNTIENLNELLSINGFVATISNLLQHKDENVFIYIFIYKILLLHYRLDNMH